MAKKKLAEMVMTCCGPDSSLRLENDDCIDGAKVKDKVTATITIQLERAEESQDSGMATISNDDVKTSGKVRKSQTWKVIDVVAEGDDEETDSEDKEMSGLHKHGLGRGIA